jgi:hypothetical protein
MPGGDHLWSLGYGDAETEAGQGIATFGSEELFFTGDFEGSIDFGGGALTSAGGSDIFLVKLQTQPSDVVEQADAYGLSVAAHPNPLASSLSVTYTVPVGGNVSLRIYDVHGRLVRVLVGETRAAGRHAAVWDGRSSNGSRVVPGVYFVGLRSPGGREISKITVLE